ncbi:MAG: hypothetical protein C4334_02220 [Pyrinomonas sp.]|uniref:SIMPL domain-containing protein n=1 Tax=Pyrinomonas sp. TaxID=2080306 RepID=UPI00331EB320
MSASSSKHFPQMIRLCLAIALLVAIGNAQQARVRGRLMRTVEPGGWIIASDYQKFLLLNAQRFEQETWFREGVEVEAAGQTRPDVVTTYQEGVPFEASTLRPVNASNQRSLLSGFTRVAVNGDADIEAQPDTAIITIAVVTQSKSALDAQQENARRSDAVQRAVKAVAGAGAEIKTSGYSLQPQMDYRPNMPPTITGYLARNSVIATLRDLTKVGAVIDEASRAGANNIDGLIFTIRQDREVRARALSEATRAALDKAQTIARSLSGRVIRILEVREGGTIRPVPQYVDAVAVRRVAEAAPPTPIEPGKLTVSANVQMLVEIEAQP